MIEDLGYGDASDYLRVPGGRPSNDVLEMIAPELRGHFVGLIQRPAFC